MHAVTTYLDRDAVLAVGSRAVGHVLEVGDWGLLDAAVARPRSTVFGADAYPDLFTKAAALLQSIARNHALLDGNKRTAWAVAWSFLYLNGVRLALDYDVDSAERFMYDVAQNGELTVDAVAVGLAAFAEQPRRPVTPGGG